MFVSGKKLGLALCQALGLETRGIRAIEIRAAVDEGAILTIEKFIGLEEAKNFVSVFEQYALAEKAPISDEAEDRTGDREPEGVGEH